MSPDPAVVLQDALRDRYRIERLLGRGGMARVYLAQDLKHDRQVAVKVLRPELTVTLGRDRFLREIQIAARLNHPHILALHDSGDANGLLYYVMPYVEGESVFQLLERQGPQPIEEAVRIAREVATALSYAHARGVLHRDIKPGNILLSDGHAVVADFGLARAVTEAQTDRSITGEGLTIGTPAYMSPEQGMGEEGLDARSDVYSLGCVLYELLAGNPPYVASNPHAILGKHAHDPVPSIRTVRPEVPEWLDRVLQKALAKEPPDRFGSAEELAEALHPPDVAAPPDRLYLRAATLAAVLLATAAGTWALGVQQGWWGRAGDGENGTPVGLDTARYAVLPVSDSADAGAIEAQLLQDALARWSGITVVDPFQIRDALDRAERPLTSRGALSVARGLGAGRYVRMEVNRLGNATRLQANLFDAKNGREIRTRSIRLPPGAETSDSMYRVLADGLLFGDEMPANRDEAARGTLSVPARRAFTRGYAAITRWELNAADSAFSQALGFDPQYAQSALWLALSRQWAGLPRSTWQYAAEQAVAGRQMLSARDRVMAEAVLRMSRADYTTTCALWRRLTDEEPHDFAVWYGLGTCLSRDQGVVRDARTASGWRFRSSRHQAQTAFQQAFRLLPSIHSGMRGGAFQEVRRLLVTSLGLLQQGRAVPPDTGTFWGYPAWEGDTLLLIPYRAADVSRARKWVRPATALEALTRQRQAFFEIARGWVAAYPGSPDALEALGLALEMIGNANAVDTVRKARRLARDEETAARMAVTETWMRLRLALPSQLEGLRIVRAMADSLLRRAPEASSEEAHLLAPLASLTGRGLLAAELSRRAGDRRSLQVPAAVAGDGVALLTFAALAAPAESLAALEARLDATIEQAMDSRQKVSARLQWVGRPATIAFPDYRSTRLIQLAGQNDYLIDAQAAFLRNDYEGARSILEGVSEYRVGAPASTIMIDALLPETQLLALMGQRDRAATELDSTLLAQRFTAPHLMADVSRAGTLVRAMARRAELAAQMGDMTTARTWAEPVRILWSEADSYLQATLRRMAQLTAR